MPPVPAPTPSPSAPETAPTEMIAPPPGPLPEPQEKAPLPEDLKVPPMMKPYEVTTQDIPNSGAQMIQAAAEAAKNIAANSVQANPMPPENEGIIPPMPPSPTPEQPAASIPPAPEVIDASTIPPSPAAPTVPEASAQ